MIGVVRASISGENGTTSTSAATASATSPDSSPIC